MTQWAAGLSSQSPRHLPKRFLKFDGRNQTQNSKAVPGGKGQTCAFGLKSPNNLSELTSSGKPILDRGDYTVCYTNCKKDRLWSDEMVQCRSGEKCSSKAPFGLFHDVCWGDVGDGDFCIFCMR